MEKNAESWENDYSRRGRIWGGAVHDLPDILPGHAVLELGCGNGKTFSALLNRGCTVTGIDFSKSAAIMCSRNNRAFPGSHVVIADAGILPFAASSFDEIIACHIVGHLDKRGRGSLVRESFRVLKPGGSLYFSGFSTEDFRAGNGIEQEPGTFVRKNGISTHYFTETEVRDLFAGYGSSRITTSRWALTVRGRQYPRAEIIAQFKKEC